MADLFWLSDAQWAVIEPFMPRNQPGARRVDDRRTISGIVHVIRSGCRWQDCPRDYGPPTTVYNRFNRWSRLGAACCRPSQKLVGLLRAPLWTRPTSRRIALPTAVKGGEGAGHAAKVAFIRH